MAQSIAAITPDVGVFLQRALPHFLAGMSVADSMRAVLDDDARLATAFFERGQSFYIPTPDECGRSGSTDRRKGDVIVSEIAHTVYRSFTALPPASRED